MAAWRFGRAFFRFFTIAGIGFIVAGFFVDPAGRTDDGYPLNVFFWVFGGSWLLMDAGSLAVSRVIAARRKNALENWLPASARVLDASETGTYINGMPRLRFSLEVTGDAQGTYLVDHRETIPMLRLTSFGIGTVHQIRVNPRNPRKIVFAR